MDNGCLRVPQKPKQLNQSLLIITWHYESHIYEEETSNISEEIRILKEKATLNKIHYAIFFGRKEDICDKLVVLNYLPTYIHTIPVFLSLIKLKKKKKNKKFGMSFSTVVFFPQFLFSCCLFGPETPPEMKRRRQPI